MTVTVRSAAYYRALRVAHQVLVYVLVVAGAITFGLPFFWMVRSAIMPGWQVYKFPPEWIPKAIELEWFREAFVAGYGFTFQGWLWNSFVISTLSAFGAMVSSSIVAFSFARMRFPGRDLLFILVLASMILPIHVRLIPTYLLFSMLGWVGSYKPLVVPIFFSPAFFVFLLRQFFMTIPRDMDDAAYIDGCSPLTLFLRIHLPMSLPAMGVVLIFQFTGMWNEFLQPLLYVREARRFPVALGLRMFQTQFYQTRIQALMCASLISMIPPITLFFVAQRHFVQGIVITGIKG